jgi:hypothetical protein
MERFSSRVRPLDCVRWALRRPLEGGGFAQDSHRIHSQLNKPKIVIHSQNNLLDGLELQF